MLASVRQAREAAAATQAREVERDAERRKAETVSL
jgi:hypothetical protein